MVDIAKLTVRLEAENSKLRKDLEKSKKQLGRFGKDSRRITDSIKAQFAGLAAGVSVVAFTGLVKRTVDAGDKIQKLSIRLGASTEALSELKLATELTGVSFQTLTTGLQRMTRRISEAAKGTGESVKALDELGLSAKALNKLRPEQQFEALADALDKVPNQADKVRLSMKLLDTEGVALLQTMEGGSEAIRGYRKQARELGLSLSKDSADAFAKANDQLTILSGTFTGFVQSLTVSAIPIVQDLTSLFSSLKNEIDGLNKSSLFAVNEQISETFTAINKIEGRRQKRGGGNGFFDFITGEKEELEGLKITLENLKVQKDFLMQRESAIVGPVTTNTPEVSLAPGESNLPKKAAKTGGGKSSTRRTAQDELRTAIESTTARLIEQNATFGLSSELADIEKLRLQGATEAQLMQVQALTDSIVTQQQAAETEQARQQSLLQTRQVIEQNVLADKALIEALREEKMLLGLTAQEQAVYRAQAELSANATIAQKEEIKGLTIELEGMKNKVETSTDTLGDFGSGVASQINGQFQQFLFDPFNANVEDMLGNFLSALAQMAAQAAATEIINALGSGSGGASGGAGGGGG